MKEILKKAMLPIILSIVCGSICGKVVYEIYLTDNKLAYEENIIYLIQNGAYISYDSMRANTIGYDYIYYEEDDLFKTIIGVTKNKKNIEKIQKIFNNEIKINSYFIDDYELNEKIKEYDNMLFNEDDDEKIKEIIIKMINLYKNKENIKMTKIDPI